MDDNYNQITLILNRGFMEILQRGIVTIVPGERKVVLILGAGSTLDNADTVNDFEKPPLNKHFFRKTREFLKRSQIDPAKKKEMYYQFEYVRAYFEIWHGKDIFSDEEDYLEKVMSQIFADVTEKLPEQRPAFFVFVAFMKLLYDLLGETTNNIKIDSGKPLFKIISHYLRNGVKPENLLIISFNYDIYVEKTLAAVARSFFDPDFLVFLLQHCYELGLSFYDFTLAKQPRIGWFPVRLNVAPGGVIVLKLHGSLNWYSIFPSEIVGLESMFYRDRTLKVTRELEINSNKLKYRTPAGDIRYTLPVIVPPVKNKEDLYHSRILNLWSLAGTALSEADEILIYGYSCPRLDIESEEMFRASVRHSTLLEKISIIDPSTAVYERYSKLFAPKIINSYPDSGSFLADGN